MPRHDDWQLDAVGNVYLWVAAARYLKHATTPNLFAVGQMVRARVLDPST